MSNIKITPEILTEFLVFIKKPENQGYGLCNLSSYFLGEGFWYQNYLDRFFATKKPLSAIKRCNSNHNILSERGYWWSSDDMKPRIRFLEEHIKALRMSPIKRYFYRIYLFFTL